MAKIEIEGGGVRVSIEAEEPSQSEVEAGKDVHPDWPEVIKSVASNWKDAVAIVTNHRIAELRLTQAHECAMRTTERAVVQGGSAGFQAEQADEWRNGTLPGGDAA